MDFGIYAGDTSKTIYLRLRDSTTGLAKTGLVYNSTGFTCSYTLPAAARAAITMVTTTVAASWTSGGFVLVDDTNCKGLYRLDLPNDAIASGAFTIISIEFDGVIEESMQVELHTRKVNTIEISGTTQTANDVGLDTNEILTDTGTTIPNLLPTALVGGRMDCTIDATGFEQGAIDNIWDELKSAHVVANSFGDFLDIEVSGVDAAVWAEGTRTLTAATNITSDASAINVTAGVVDSVATTTTNTDVTALDAKVGTVSNLGGGATLSFNNSDMAGATFATATDSLENIYNNTGLLGATLTDLGGMSTGMKAEVQVEANAATLDVMATDTFAEPAQGAPPATASMEEKISWIYATFRNKKTQSATVWTLRNDADTSDICTAAVSDAAGTFAKAEIISGV